MEKSLNLSTKRIKLRPVVEEDCPLLFGWRNTPKFLSHFSAHRAPIDYEKFLVEFKRDSTRNRHLQFVVERLRDGAPIGLIYTFNFNSEDGNVFLNTYIVEKCERTGHGAIATILLICHLFESPLIHKIYLDVFAYNVLSLSCLRSAEFAEEGRFREHRLFNGCRHDVFRFAAYRNCLERFHRILAHQ